jgi:hypothetical protein
MSNCSIRRDRTKVDFLFEQRLQRDAAQHADDDGR